MNDSVRARRRTSNGDVARFAISIVLCVICQTIAEAQTSRPRGSVTRARPTVTAASNLNGVYRLDPLASDKLYSIVSEANTSLPYAKQNRFFDDLIVRLSSPDQLAIERRGTTIRIASSRAPRMTLATDAAAQTGADATVGGARTQIVSHGDGFTFSSSGDGEDDFKVTFESLDGGARLRVTRSITTAGLNEPVVVRSIYNRVSEIARWDIYAGTPTTDVATRTRKSGIRESASDKTNDSKATNRPASVRDTAPAREIAPARTAGIARASTADTEVELLRANLNEWLAATNSVDIGRQMEFYSPRVAAYYLARDVNLAGVRAEKERTFRNADRVAISAGDPEIIFADSGRTAVMRFSKSYDINWATRRRRGEVVQELRWRRTPEGWRIFSERDVRVIR